MRILVLHSAVSANPRPDEQDTLDTAAHIAEALTARGHAVTKAAFVPQPEALRETVRGADCVFNLVESVHGEDELAALAPSLLDAIGIPYTGSTAAAMAFTTDKPATKRVLRAAGLATADWSEGPAWAGLDPHKRYIVKAVKADCSYGLDAGAVVMGGAVPARARDCAARLGQRWFAEEFVDGREFNIAMLDDGSGVRLLPLAEMAYFDWDLDAPRIVTYGAKWDENDPVNDRTRRRYGWERDEPALAKAIGEAALACWHLFGLRGYARVDFRAGGDGVPVILEVNTNPCLAPDAGYAIAAAEAGIAYPELIEIITRSASGG